MSCLLEPAIWPRDTGEWIPCLDRCQLIVTWLSNIKEVHSKPRLYFCQPLFCSMAAMLRDSVVVLVVRTRPRAIPLATRTMRKWTHGFPFLSHDKYGAPLGGPSGRWSSAIITRINKNFSAIFFFVLSLFWTSSRHIFKESIASCLPSHHIHLSPNFSFFCHSKKWIRECGQSLFVSVCFPF